MTTYQGEHGKTAEVMACIDGSASAEAVCDYAAWAAQRLNAPLTLLHVLDEARYPTQADLSGSIGLGSREHLLDELAALDARRNKLALEQGRLMLDAARERVLADGVPNPVLRQRHGDLAESLQDLQGELRLLVLGKVGEDHPTPAASRQPWIGGNLERVIRSLQRPILITPATFRLPQNLMLAFDGSATTRKCVEMLADSPLCVGLPCHLVMVAEASPETRSQLDWAQQTLTTAGFQVITALRQGSVEESLRSYQREQQIELMLMGAYGHSRIRQFLVGSNTTAMISNAEIPLLILR